MRPLDIGAVPCRPESLKSSVSGGFGGLPAIARFSWYAGLRAGMHQCPRASRHNVAFEALALIFSCIWRKDRELALPMCNVSPYSLAKVVTSSRVAINKRGRALGIALPLAHLAQEEN